MNQTLFKNRLIHSYYTKIVQKYDKNLFVTYDVKREQYELHTKKLFDINARLDSRQMFWKKFPLEIFQILFINDIKRHGSAIFSFLHDQELTNDENNKMSLNNLAWRAKEIEVNKKGQI